MDWIEEDEIGTDWTKRPQKERENLLLQLRNYFTQLRKISHPKPGVVAAADISHSGILDF